MVPVLVRATRNLTVKPVDGGDGSLYLIAYICCSNNYISHLHCPLLPLYRAVDLLESPTCMLYMLWLFESIVCSQNFIRLSYIFMSSGFGLFTEKGRCNSFWNDVMNCYDTHNYPHRQCTAQVEDYLECLHHTKEVIISRLRMLGV